MDWSRVGSLGCWIQGPQTTPGFLLGDATQVQDTGPFVTQLTETMAKNGPADRPPCPSGWIWVQSRPPFWTAGRVLLGRTIGKIDPAEGSGALNSTPHLGKDRDLPSYTCLPATGTHRGEGREAGRDSRSFSLPSGPRPGNRVIPCPSCPTDVCSEPDAAGSCRQGPRPLPEGRCPISQGGPEALTRW